MKLQPKESQDKRLTFASTSTKNDRNCESTGLTDSEKIVNHGFDKKTSFRKM